jgi:hypothetical protein
MTDFQDNQFLTRPFYLINDAIVADSVFETIAPFLTLKRLVAQEFEVMADPFYLIQEPFLKRSIKALQVGLRFGCKHYSIGLHLLICLRNVSRSISSPFCACSRERLRAAMKSGRRLALSSSGKFIQASVNCVSQTSRRLSIVCSTNSSNSLVDNVPKTLSTVMVILPFSPMFCMCLFLSYHTL